MQHFKLIFTTVSLVISRNKLGFHTILLDPLTYREKFRLTIFQRQRKFHYYGKTRTNISQIITLVKQYDLLNANTINSKGLGCSQHKLTMLQC